ncbi:hypothetical protein BDR22DRAFT_860148 [Usnea florida]
MPCYDSKQHLQTEVKQYIMHVDADTATNTGASSVSSLPLESVSEQAPAFPPEQSCHSCHSSHSNHSSHSKLREQPIFTPSNHLPYKVYYSLCYQSNPHSSYDTNLSIPSAPVPPRPCSTTFGTTNTDRIGNAWSMDCSTPRAWDWSTIAAWRSFVPPTATVKAYHWERAKTDEMAPCHALLQE